jgi:hypothetical protein
VLSAGIPSGFREAGHHGENPCWIEIDFLFVPDVKVVTSNKCFRNCRNIREQHRVHGDRFAQASNIEVKAATAGRSNARRELQTNGNATSWT